MRESISIPSGEVENACWELYRLRHGSIKVYTISLSFFCLWFVVDEIFRSASVFLEEIRGGGPMRTQKFHYGVGLGWNRKRRRRHSLLRFVPQISSDAFTCNTFSSISSLSHSSFSLLICYIQYIWNLGLWMTR